MHSSDYLAVARELIRGGTEAHHRAAAGRAYYALVWEVWGALERWGIGVPRQQTVHAFLRLRLVYAADPDLKEAGRIFERAQNLRIKADYWRTGTSVFTTAAATQTAIREVEKALPC